MTTVDARPVLLATARTMSDLPGWQAPGHIGDVHTRLLDVADWWDGRLLEQGTDSAWALESETSTPDGRPATLLLTSTACGAHWWAWGRLGRWRPDDEEAPAPAPCLVLRDVPPDVLPGELAAARMVLLAALDVAATLTGSV